jgi:hypothetical protein
MLNQVPPSFAHKRTKNDRFVEKEQELAVTNHSKSSLLEKHTRKVPG